MIQPAPLIPIDEFIQKAKKAGYKFGKGSPKNRLRYLTKTEILPHAVRLQAKETDAHTTGFYPESAIQLLLSAQKLKKPIATAVERGALPDSLVTTRERGRLRSTAVKGRWLAPALAGAAVFLIVLSQTVFGKFLGERMAAGIRSALFPQQALQKLVEEAEGKKAREGQEGGKQYPGRVLAEDDFKLSDTLSLKYLIVSSNLLKNSSFESAGSTAPAAFWQFHPNSTDGNTQRSNHTAHSGSYGLLITADTGGVIQEATKTKSNRSYTLGVWVKVNKGQSLQGLSSQGLSFSGKLHLALGPGWDKSFEIDSGSAAGMTGGGQWQYYSTTFDNPPPGLVPRIYISDRRLLPSFRQETPGLCF